MEKPLDAKELERKLKKDQKAREEEKKIKAKQKEAPRLQAQAVSDGGGAKKSDKKLRKKGAMDESPEDFIDPETPAGQKKLLASQMAKQYSPAAVEKSWYAWWESSRYFEVDAASSKPPFVIVQPPPNVTGVLHIGHAITAAIEDAIIRWRRMSGYNALWVPGMDHAGIATQVVVEKKLMREKNLSRHDVGREKFLCEVLKWKEQHGGAILKQLRILGASLDWSRECFTMDELRSKAVTGAFVRLYKDGLIYRAHRLVNWDCTLRTAISDIEVDHEDLAGETPLEVPGYKSPVQFGVLISFAYPLEEGLGEIIVATTRIETMLGDTAIAVHPQDGRYKHLHGKYALHPFNGRKLKIICDLALTQNAVLNMLITPAHDPNDFKVGEWHNLEFINIFTDDGKINEMGGFEGMPRFSARTSVIDALKNKCNSIRAFSCLSFVLVPHCHNLGSFSLCSRSKDVVEPMMKPQWFVSCNSMAKGALDAVKSKKIEIISPQYEQDWYRWLENIRDWCISRQLWWGHRIPAWYVTLEDDKEKDMGSYSDHWIIARDENDAILEAKQRYPGKKYQLYQDPDVRDTWFSSGLFPLSVLGWPDDKPDLSTFYPSSVLETGSDILFFWVARMVMMGMQLGGDVPFQKVYLHPIIRDAHGRKMAKSLGNVIDPIDVINGISLENLQRKLEDGNLDPKEREKAKEGQRKDFPNGIPECGTDALRFALISYTSQLWNAIRFAMNKLGDQYVPPATIAVCSLPPVCKWILSVLNKAVGKTESSLEAYKFSEATSSIYSWWQYQLCDVYIEAIKPYFNESQEFESARGASRDTLWVCLDMSLRLLHPFMPYITEELWETFSFGWQEWTNDQIENEMEIVLDTVNKLRSLRPSTDTYERFLQTAATIRSYHSYITTLASVSSLKILAEDDPTPLDCATHIVNKDLSVYLQLRGALDTKAEREKLRRKREEIQRQHDALSQNMNASGYREKAPQSKQDEDTRKLAALLGELEIVDEAESKLDANN
ncbi:hypothetical protein GQ55_9G191100 [Panicum hallii var. hallii]|uniref:valine--tRNA ligase n=1 Tax=Panicum hallii var. hallii TaxID=1504633 RepID=A0A2T7C4V7_9POAL|nr:hypothetical protein GQ55_9G191100 [Panicum hallii var. hallii]